MGEARGPLARRVFAAAALALVAACAWRAGALVDRYGVDLVLMDQLDFLRPLFDALEGRPWPALDELRFQFPGSPHRMGLGWPVIEAVARASGWSTRADGFAIVAVLALAAALALWLDARLAGRLDAASLALPVAVLTTRQYTTFVGTTDVALGALPVLLVVALALATTLRDARARVAAVLALDLACVYTGFALFAGALAPLLVAREAWLGRIGPRAAAAAFAASVAIGLSFFAGWDAGPALGPASSSLGPGGVLAYATALWTSFFAVGSPALAHLVGLAWPVLLGAPLAVAFARTLGGDGDDVHAVVLVLSGFGALFVAANAVGRSGEAADIAYAFAPRYATLMLPGALGAYFAARGYLRGAPRALALAAFGLAIVAGEVVAAHRDRASLEWLAASKRAWAACYVEARDVAACNERARFELYPWRDAYPRIEHQLALLEERGLNLFAPRAIARVAAARAEAPPAPPDGGARASAPVARRTGAPPPRHVLVVSVDTLRADHLGLYGYARPTSPAIDALGARGVVFEHAMSTSSWTLPAHASLLTGRYPYQHRVQDDGVRLGDDVPTLAEALRARGLATLAVVSHLYVASPFGLARGFDVFDDALIEGGTTNPRADAVVDRFLARLDAHLARGAEGGGARPDGAAAAPFFGFVHLFDPHWDYGAPAPYGRRFVDPAYRGPMDGSFAAMTPFVLAAGALAPADRAALVALYDGEIAWVDAQIARLLDALAARGVRDDTLVVITGDHGEEFGEHGRLGHGRTLFEEQLHVPLVVQHASLAPRRESAPASLVDVAATVLDALGGEADAFGAGRSLLAAAPAQAEPRERVLLAESIRYGLEWRAARRGPHKLVELADGAERWFFDLADDPGERRPAARDPSEDGALGAAFERFRSDADDGFQIKLVAHDGERLRLRARIEAQGPGAAIVGARHYASGHIAGREVRFGRFELVDGGAALEVDAVVAQHVGTIRFDVAPPGSAVRIATRELSLLAPGATVPAAVALRAADGTALGEEVRVERAGARDDAGARAPDARAAPAAAFAARLSHPAALASGAYVRAAPTAAARAPALGADVRRHLEALGYGEGAGGSGADDAPEARSRAGASDARSDGAGSPDAARP